jgi:hypothetical protein
MSGRRRAINPKQLEFFMWPLSDGDILYIYGSLNQIRKYLRFTDKMMKDLQRKHWIDMQNQSIDISFGEGQGSWHNRARLAPKSKFILTAK